MFPYDIFPTEFTKGLLDGIFTAGLEINESEEYSFSFEFVLEKEGLNLSQQLESYNSLKSQNIQLFISSFSSKRLNNLAPQSTLDQKLI